MDRRAFIGTVGGGLLAAPVAAEAQEALRDPAMDKQSPELLLLAFVFVVVVLFLLCAGLLMLVFRRVRPLKPGSWETGPRLRLPEEPPHKVIAPEEPAPADSAQPSGGLGPRSAGPPRREESRDAGGGDPRGGRGVTQDMIP